MLSGSECAALVAPHQAGVADNVCGEDRRQFALHGPREVSRFCETVLCGCGPNCKGLAYAASDSCY